MVRETSLLLLGLLLQLDITRVYIPLSSLDLAELIVVDHINVMTLSILFHWDALVLLLVELILLVMPVLAAQLAVFRIVLAYLRMMHRLRAYSTI